MKRGEVWLADVGRERRPVVVLTRTAVLDVRELVTVGGGDHIIRGLATEVEVDHVRTGLDRPSVINCDGLHTIPQASPPTQVGFLSDDTMRDVCEALYYAVDC